MAMFLVCSRHPEAQMLFLGVDKFEAACSISESPWSTACFELEVLFLGKWEVGRSPSTREGHGVGNNS